jgi:hypothetical protein
MMMSLRSPKEIIASNVHNQRWKQTENETAEAVLLPNMVTRVVAPRENQLLKLTPGAIPIDKKYSCRSGDALRRGFRKNRGRERIHYGEPRKGIMYTAGNPKTETEAVERAGHIYSKTR